MKDIDLELLKKEALVNKDTRTIAVLFAEYCVPFGITDVSSLTLDEFAQVLESLVESYRNNIDILYTLDMSLCLFNLNYTNDECSKFIHVFTEAFKECENQDKLKLSDEWRQKYSRPIIIYA
jgi:hypothetical protein